MPNYRNFQINRALGETRKPPDPFFFEAKWQKINTIILFFNIISSQKSKKSTRSDRFANRANKHRRNPSNSDSRPASRPQSRNNSRSNNNNNNSRSSRNYRGSSRGRRRSISTEDEVDSDDAVVNDFSQSHLGIFNTNSL